MSTASKKDCLWILLDRRAASSTDCSPVDLNIMWSKIWTTEQFYFLFLYRL